MKQLEYRTYSPFFRYHVPMAVSDFENVTPSMSEGTGGKTENLLHNIFTQSTYLPRFLGRYDTGIYPLFKLIMNLF